MIRIELTTDGGLAAIPGLAKPVVLDDASLPADNRKQLRRLVDAALLEQGQDESAKTGSVPDGRRCRMTIERDGKRYGMEADDPEIPAAFDALMEFVKANGRR